MLSSDAKYSPDHARTPIRIALVFHSFTSGNLGVGALSLANTVLATQAAQAEGLEPQFVSIGMRDGDNPPLLGGRIPAVVVDRRNLAAPGGLWAAFGQVDCALNINVGDSFTDIYGWRRLIFLAATTLICIARRVPTIFSPQTIGPFRTPRSRRLARFILRRMRVVLARDEASFAFTRTLSAEANVLLATDLAFGLPFEDRRHLRGGSRDRVGVNVSGLLFALAESGRNPFGMSIDYAHFSRALIRALLGRGAEVHLVTHASSRKDATDDDRRYADLLMAEFPDLVRAPDFVDPSEAKSYISGLDFLVAGRMHACIGAYSAGTPVVPIAYSRKFDGLFGSLGYRWLVPVSGMDDAEALSFTLDALDRRDTLARDMAAGMMRVESLLDTYRRSLRTIFRELRDEIETKGFVTTAAA